MTDPERPAADTRTLDEQVRQLQHDAEAMKRDNRAIPLPDDKGAEEDHDGVGRITGIVP